MATDGGIFLRLFFTGRFCVLPVLIMIGSGLLLLLKGEMDWVQPPTVRGQVGNLSLSMEKTFSFARLVKR